MKCPHLSGTRILFCTVNRAVYVPSLFELEEYCTTSRFSKCPLLRSRSQEEENASLSHSPTQNNKPER
jgi:hypothetical protein